MAQAGGGIPISQTHMSWINMTPSSHLHFEHMYKRLVREHGLMANNSNGYQALLDLCPDLPRQAQAALTSGNRGMEDILIEYLRSPNACILAHVVDNDLSYPMSNYFISTSHNTYLTGNQLSSDSSIEAYRNVLLRGCRSVEVDVWDGKPPIEESSDEDEVLSGKLHGLLGHLHLGKHKSNDDHLKPATQPSTESDDLSLPTPWSVTKQVEPRVLHGHTLTKEISFQDVCEVIRDSAFVNSDLPVIVSLEVHACLEQQERMVHIMRKVWGTMLVEEPLRNEQMDGLKLPSPAELRNRILVKVKYSPPEKAKKQKLQATAPTKSLRSSSVSSTSSDENNGTRADQPKKRKMIDELSQLGVYARSYHFTSFDQPEAKIPTHVFSLSENALLEAQETTAQTILKHNRDFMMRAYPKGLRVSSSNLNPPLFWRLGVQSVALNWQDCDKGVMLNEGMFAGTGGWALKPHSHRGNANPANIIKAQALAGPNTSRNPKETPAVTAYKDLTLSIEFFFAQNLPTPPGMGARLFHPCVKCTLHVETLQQKTERTSKIHRLLHHHHGGAALTKYKSSEDDPEKAQLKGRTRAYKGTSPEFLGDKITFRGVCVDEASFSFLRFKVVDDVDLGINELAAWACLRLDRVKTGLRTVRLLDTMGKPTDAFLVVMIDMQEMSSTT